MKFTLFVWKRNMASLALYQPETSSISQQVSTNPLQNFLTQSDKQSRAMEFNETIIRTKAD